MPSTPPAAADAAKPPGLDWIGSVFRIDGEGKTLIVIPVAEASGLIHQKLHIESNALLRKFETRLFTNLVFDLGSVDYFGSELIGSLIRLGRNVTTRGGRVAFCAASPQMLQVLETMRLSKLWPMLPTRADALQNVNP